jgi:pimeloyl-ACP methyl ester carboxylesterase
MGPPAVCSPGVIIARVPPLSHAATPILDVAFEVSGPGTGMPVILLHGWPDDVRTWDGVLPALHAAGFTTIAPYVRGCGPTAFRSPDTMRSGQLSALGRDVLDFADALCLDQFAVVGHDWGARAAYIAAASAPDRITRCVALSVGWGTNDPQQPLSLEQARNYWYHWYLALDRGADAVRHEREALTRFLWTTWGPAAWIADAAFEVTARSFANPDWAEVVIHSYRHRWGLARGDPAYAGLEAALQPAPSLSTPTLVIHGGDDRCNDPATSANRERSFSRLYERLVLDGIGHFPSREAPEAVGRAIADFLTR